MMLPKKQEGAINAEPTPPRAGTAIPQNRRGMRSSESMGDLFEFHQQPQKFETVKIKLHEFDPRLNFRAIYNSRPKTGQGESPLQTPVSARAGPCNTALASPSRGAFVGHRPGVGFFDFQGERTAAKTHRLQGQNLDLIMSKQRPAISLSKRRGTGQGTRKNGASQSNGTNGQNSKELTATPGSSNIEGMFSQSQQRMLFLKNFRSSQQPATAGATGAPINAQRPKQIAKASIRLKSPLPSEHPGAHNSNPMPPQLRPTAPTQPPLYTPVNEQ